MSITLTTLGAGREVGRSCVIVNINGFKVMFDCGVNMIYNDSRKFPDFRMIENKDATVQDKNIYANIVNTTDCNFTESLDLIIISHFHLDHCGALPYFTEICKYKGPILMTQPTKAILPVTLEDFRRIISDMKGEKSLISNQDIQNMMLKIKTIELNESIIVNNKVKITTYYAGHVVGAAMYHVEYNGLSVTYTGDYNTAVDRHLNSAYLPKLNQNVLITETTYGSTIRDTKRSREREFLDKVVSVISNKGKVLIPTFAFGRAQELCILLDTHWKRNKIKIPIYFFGALSEKSNIYYKIFTNWMNERVKNSVLEKNVFEFSNITSNSQSKLSEAYKNLDTPMVILSTPGMLHGGMSLNIFKEICSFENNCVIIPGYCTPNTVGNKILNGEKLIEIDKKIYNVNCEIVYMSFSAHADAKGLLSLIKNSNPKNLVMVHGDEETMNIFDKSLSSLLPTMKTHMPKNFYEIHFDPELNYYRITLDYSIFDIIKNKLVKNNDQLSKLSNIKNANKLKLKDKFNIKSVNIKNSIYLVIDYDEIIPILMNNLKLPYNKDVNAESKINYLLSFFSYFLAKFSVKDHFLYKTSINKGILQICSMNKFNTKGINITFYSDNSLIKCNESDKIFGIVEKIKFFIDLLNTMNTKIIT